MKIESFIIEIQNGEIKWNSEYHERLFKSYLSQFEGKQRLSIETLKSKRSEEQNRYYWFYLGLVSEETGYTTDELHSLFKGMFLTKEVKEVLGKPVRITKSTTGLSKGEFVEYLLNISLYTEIPLPDTTEFYGYSYHK